jgi:phytoene synthase
MQFGVTRADLMHTTISENFRRLMAFQAQRALQTYDEALALLPATDRKAQRPGLIMAAIYRALLEEIRTDGYHVLDRRISLTPLRKLWLAWLTWVKE